MPDNNPPRLPRGAPRDLARFVRCEVDEVALDLTDMGWLLDGIPILKGGSVTVQPGSTSTRGTITVDGPWSPEFNLDVSIVDGQLDVSVQGAAGEVFDEVIDEWTDALNRTLRENGKQLRDFDVDGNRLTLRKQPIPPATEGPPPAGVAPVATPSTTEAPTEESEPPRKPSGCLAWLVGALVAIGAAVGITLAVTGGDDGDDGDAISTGQDGSAPATPASSSTTSTSSSTTTSSVAEVSDAPPPTDSSTDSPTTIRVCGVDVDVSTGGNAIEEYLLNQPLDRGPCEPGPTSYTNVDCDPAFLACADGSWLFFLLFGDQPGIDHSGSVPDAVTDEEGNSTALFEFYANLFGDEVATLLLGSQCGPNLLSGETTITDDDLNVLEQPLESFGPCEVDRYQIQFGPPGAGGPIRDVGPLLGVPYDVGPEEPDPDTPVTDQFVASSPRFEVSDDWSLSFHTVANTFAAEPLPTECFWFFEPTNVEVLVKVLDGCEAVSGMHLWIFAAGSTDVEVTLGDDSTVVGHGGGFVDPFGGAFESVGDTASFGTSDPLFDNSLFPCGPGDIAVTACPAGEPDVDAGGFVAVSASTVAPIPIAADGVERTHTVDFGVAGGPAYMVDLSDDGWTVSSTGDTRARALIRHNSLTLVVPNDELPEGALAYEWSTTVDGRTHAQPVVPVVSGITTPAIDGGGAPAPEPPATDPPTTDAPGTTETVVDFYAGLSASISSGDLSFALDRLDPTVYEAYPTECPAALESFVDPDFAATPVDLGDTGPWTWELPDGRSFDIDEATTVTITLSGRGQTGAEVDAHVTVIDGEYHWFTFCA